MLLADQMGTPMVFTGNNLGPFDLGKAFFANMFRRVKSLKMAVRDQMYSKIWFDQLATSHEVTFIPDDLLFIHPDIQAMTPTIEVASDHYIVLEAYQPMDVILSELDAIKNYVRDMKHHYDLDIIFLPLNIGNGGPHQGQFLKERISEIILIDYSDKDYFTNSRYSTYFRTSRNMINSRYHA